jgi:hypothetical protein
MKRILLGGLLGAVVLVAWLIVADGILGLKRGIDMKELVDERVVYAFLVEHVKEPGRYICNPEVLPEQRFPGHDPIFAVHYTGLGHDDAGQEMLAGLLIAFLASTAGALLLANASSRVLSRYGSRVLFFAAIGIVVVLMGIGARFGLASYPLGDAVALAVHDLGAWVLAGLAVAAVVKSRGGEAATKAG